MKKHKLRKYLFRGIFLLVLFYFGAIAYRAIQIQYILPFPETAFSIKHRFFNHLYFYTDKISYFPGESVGVFVSSSKDGEAEISLKPVLSKKAIVQKSVQVEYQSVPEKSYENGVNWQKTLSLKIPKKIESGWFVVKAKLGKRIFHQTICILPKKIKKKILLVLSTNTWATYNHFGGHSLYTIGHPSKVSLQRPNPMADPFLKLNLENLRYYPQSAKNDLAVVKFLTQENFEFDVISDKDLNDKTIDIDQYATMIISTHSEYWTEKMVKNLELFLEKGGSVLSLSGNTLYWSSKITDKNQLFVEKAESNLWFYKNPKKTGLLGVTTTYDMLHTYTPYKVKSDTSWVFAGTDLKNGDLFGKKSDTYDFVLTKSELLKMLLFGSLAEKKGAASGFEIETTSKYTPKNWQTIAIGLNPGQSGLGNVYPDEEISWKNEKAAVMGYYSHQGGGLVFNVGSVAFTGAIPYSKDIQQILKNVLNRTLELNKNTGKLLTEQ